MLKRIEKDTILLQTMLTVTTVTTENRRILKSTKSTLKQAQYPRDLREKMRWV